MSAYPNAPGHRNVETSVAAANALAPKLGRLQQMAHEAIREAGARGRTADELAERLGMDRYSIQPRTSELRRKGLICDSGERRRNATGKMAIVWVAA
ncbi:helix-turn-helix domain-containing protein [Croceicoccus sp. Ery15]|uniref:helix-turn-helix domain-containing protein n=1 Tax=Croceicoccus sp. Ery15 TaxID=1703338 RepID=UPI001E3C37F7|nr:helix-turn-helix domain-containing protein [Croceicoccus sp. Ery15]